MSPSEVLGFLLPQWSDPLQMGFLTIILLMMGFTIISTHRTANPASWERKWNRGTPNDRSDDLDIEHGSVTDLWQAVATAPEKLAEIMPGMLLVVGLLGTFLGLGLALNHASHILAQPNALSASGAASSMQDLLGLLQGLGTKFKTSTWGITGFVVLKIWSEFTRFEEKRLTWVIGKVKVELESRKQAQSAADTAKSAALFAQIGGAADCIVKGFAEQITKLMGHNKALHGYTISSIQQGTQEIREEFGRAHAEAATTNTIIANGFAEHISELKRHDKELHQKTMFGYDQGVKCIRDDLEKVYTGTRAVQVSMSSFTEGTMSIVENMANAAQRMAGGADNVGEAASQLLNAVDDFKSQFTEVLGHLRESLGFAIKEMSTQASETLERGSEQLGAATQGISNALDELSTIVKSTMNEVNISINGALNKQQKAAEAFSITNDELTRTIAATTEIINEVKNSIEGGLQGVGESGSHMRVIGRNLEKSVKSMGDVSEQLINLPIALEKIFDHLGELPKALEPLKNFPTEQQKVIEALEPLGALQMDQQALLRELQSLRDELKSRTAVTQTALVELA